MIGRAVTLLLPLYREHYISTALHFPASDSTRSTNANTTSILLHLLRIVDGGDAVVANAVTNNTAREETTGEEMYHLGMD